jgi:hypothetical protein
VAQRDARTDDEIWGELEQSTTTLTRMGTSKGRGGTHIVDPWGAESSESWQTRTAALPLCRVGCGTAVNGSVLLPPLSSRGRRWGGDARGAYDWTCWIAHHTYHAPPGCAAPLGLGSVGPESLSWTTHDALLERCRLPDWSPAGAARAWRERRREAARGANDATAAVVRPVTVLLWGSSLTRGTFEALVCRWNEEISGGFLNIDGVAEQPLAAARAGGGSCHGAGLDDTHGQTWAALWEKLYPNATHGAQPFQQNSKSCTDNWACVEFGGGEREGGGQPTLRLCYAFYGMRNIAAGNPNTWAFCRAGLRLDEVDVLISEQSDVAFASSLATLQAESFASCGGGGPPSFVTLRLGTVLGLRPVVDELARDALAQVRGLTGSHPYLSVARKTVILGNDTMMGASCAVNCSRQKSTSLDDRVTDPKSHTLYS